MNQAEIKKFLDEKVELYNQKSFITTDPISIPHLFTQKEDIEISGFITAIISWGQRTTILNNARRLFQTMDMAPYQFILHHSDKDLKSLPNFVHRTFQHSDLLYFIEALRNIYTHHGGLENCFTRAYLSGGDIMLSISKFKEIFFELDHLPRTQKHLPSPDKGSAAKRLNMFLRWMVRKDNCGVDFGIWQNIPPSALYPPLDVHSARTARKLGLLSREQDDAVAVKELRANLLQLDAEDPVKYDFALYGLGVFEKR
jgi:uncharacterized protein (TIGR02757 family)